MQVQEGVWHGLGGFCPCAPLSLCPISTWSRAPSCPNLGLAPEIWEAWEGPVGGAGEPRALGAVLGAGGWAAWDDEGPAFGNPLSGGWEKGTWPR